MIQYKEIINEVELDIHSYIGLTKSKQVLEITPNGFDNCKLYIHSSIKTGKLIYSSMRLHNFSIPLEKGLESNVYKKLFTQLIKLIK